MPKNSLSSPASALQRKISNLVKYLFSPRLLTIILLIATIFLIGGGIYIAFMPAYAVASYYAGLFMIYPAIYEQTLAEGIAVMLTYALGALGLMLIYQSAKFRYNPHRASLLIRVGVALFVIAFIILEAIILYKISL